MTDPSPLRARLVHEAEQFAAAIGDLAPVLAPLMGAHRDNLIAEGFTREEAVRIAEGLQNTIVSTLMRNASRRRRER